MVLGVAALLLSGCNEDPDAERFAHLERENRELRRANEILRTSVARFAAAELDRKIK